MKLYHKEEDTKLVNYEEIEEKCKRIRQNNIKLLEDFGAWLKAKRLTDQTIREHMNNIDLFINHFLLYEDAYEAKDGVFKVDGFLGYWFIRKTMWSSVNHIKANAASLKKFYIFLVEKGEIEQDDLDDLRDTIKEEMPNWITAMKQYENSMSSDMDDVWG